MTYLKSESYYTDLYDHSTVEQCRWWVAQKFEEKVAVQLRASGSTQTKYMVDILYIRKGERFRQKSETIREWMDRDRAKDARVANAIQPSDIRCPRCGLTMACLDRDLWTRPGYPEEQILFTFTCSHCKRGRGIWEDGVEWVFPPRPCPKCQTPMTLTHKRVGNVVTTTATCPKCHHTETSTLNLDAKYVEPVDPHFEEDRKKYCMTKEEGYDYIRRIDNMKDLFEKLEEREKHKAVYDAVGKIKTLPIAALQTMLNPVIQKAGYTNFVLGTPELARGVVVEFATQDTQAGRAEYDSKQALKKLLEQTLKETNWWLMSDGISYRLGFLSGRLRGVEGEEALVELAKKRHKE